jgi:hypothetical protein
MQSAQPIGSGLDCLSISTAHWFQSGSSFNQYRFTWYRVANGSRCKQYRPLVPVWISFQSAPVYLVLITQWIKRKSARNHPATYGDYKLGYEFLILGMFYRLGNYLSPVLKNESLVIRGLQILFNYYFFLGHDGVMFRGQFRLI